MPTNATTEMISTSPAIEGLMGRDPHSFWPSEILNHPSVVSATRKRAELRQALDHLFASIPDATRDVTQALDARDVPQKVVIRVWKELTDFLNADKLHRRLVLYLPFELLPSRTWTPESKALQSAARHFLDAYEKSWRGLLVESDVRANFFDGNILEPELSSDGPERDVKAAHLIPWLVDKHILTCEDVLELARNGIGSTLRESVVDVFPALISRRHFRTSDLSSFTSSKIIRAEESGSMEPANASWIAALPQFLDATLVQFNMREALELSRGTPPKRAAWERQEKERVFLDVCAGNIALGLITHDITCEGLLPLMEAGSRLAITIVRGIRVAVESMILIEPAYARAMAERFVTALVGRAFDQSLTDEVESALSRWEHCGVEQGLLKRFGFSPRILDGAWNQKHLELLQPALMRGVQKIASDPTLSRLLYPVVLLFGSRLKEYAKRDADLDAAVFVRPGIDFEERATLQQHLKELFPSKEIDGKIVEFWLEEPVGGELRVRDFADADVSLGNSAWIHLLVNSVWMGSKPCIRKLYATLLPGFLLSKDKEVEGADARWLWLGEMERDTILYRLLHKGYRRFFTNVGGVEASAVELDPTSTFWDSAFRRLATKLFVNRVFLPQL